MKITKAALKRIIKEEIAVLEGSDAIRGSQRLGRAVDDLPSDIGSEESWDGPEELAPFWKDLTPSGVPNDLAGPKRQRRCLV